MGKNQWAGWLRQTVGRMQVSWGRSIGDWGMTSEGRRDIFLGEIQTRREEAEKSVQKHIRNHLLGIKTEK